MRSLPPNSERLLGIILTDGRNCKCRYEDSCPYAGSEWCRNIATKDNAFWPTQRPYPDAARCLYGDMPACCWVLADVERLANDYLTGAGVTDPPVPSKLINVFDENRKVEVRLVPLKALHGVVWLMSWGWVIQLNSRDSRRVRRYSLFHEAFHIACRITCPACDKIEVRRTSFNEVLADHFSTCFLMPKEWVEEHWTELKDVRALAKRFDVPVRQMRRRLHQLSLLQEATTGR